MTAYLVEDIFFVFSKLRWMRIIE